MRNKVRKKGGGGVSELLLSAARSGWLKKIFIIACLVSLFVSVFAVHLETRGDLRKTCASVAEDFSRIMQSYKHSFRLFEKLLQLEIAHTGDADAIEDFLKEQDKKLLEIEGGDYDGVYMYYKGRYLYSWDTPYEVYRDSGYDATKRPWYIGAAAAEGEVFFSVPYPSYANDYMLATISRLQPDGETVIAYDIKLGEIGKYVDKLDIYNGAKTLICDGEGNIIGSTEHSLLGGNYNLTSGELESGVSLARAELASGGELEKARDKLESALAQQEFVNGEREFLKRLLRGDGRLQYEIKDFSFGYAYDGGEYTCIVLAPTVRLLPRAAVLWVALTFVLMLLGLLITGMVGKNNQILADVLTGLNNRRALKKYCDNHIQHHAGEELSLIMLDLNEFKRINDRFGHIVGDNALLETADALKRACGEAPCGFFLCRYGGDEFLLAGSGCPPEDVERTKRLIAEKLEQKNKSGKNPYLLKAGIGVSRGLCADQSALLRLLEEADKAMYEEKTRMKHADALK